jgi:prevent-host-death family protein
MVRTVSKSALEAGMFELLRDVEETGDELIVTDNHQPVFRIVPIRKRVPAAQMFADVRGKLAYHEDILAPTSDAWPR